MEIDCIVVGRSRKGGVSQSTFKTVREDENVGDGDLSNNEYGDKILYLTIGCCSNIYSF